MQYTTTNQPLTQTKQSRSKTIVKQTHILKKKAAYSAAFSIFSLNNLNWSTVG